MAAPPPPPSRRDSSPALPDEIVEEILLRLPPDDPACLLRASLGCKTWSCAVSSPCFRRRLHELHRAPPVLGFIHNHNWYTNKIHRFIPTTASSFSLAAPDFRSWWGLDCRHGRVLFLSHDTEELLVWEPITGAQRRIPVPATSGLRGWPAAAVVCAADGCNHIDCQGGPFHLACVFSAKEDTGAHKYVTSAFLYSSETGTWRELTSMQDHFDFVLSSSVLVGRSLLYFMSGDGRILEYDLARQGLRVIDLPKSQSNRDGFILMLAEDGGVGLVQGLDPHLKLWSRKASDGTNAQWVLNHVIYLENLLPNDALVNATGSFHVLGFAEGANVIFVNTVAGLFTIELQSQRVRKVCEYHGFRILIPIVSFYTPVHRDKHQDLLPLSPSEEESGEDESGEEESGKEEIGEEESGEEGGDEEKTVEQAQQPFDEGPNAIKKRDFVNACFSHALENRVPRYKEVALECASMEYGCALLQKPQEVDDPFDDVPRSVPNEESVTGAVHKDDSGN